MLQRNLSSGNAERLIWEDLAAGVPTIAALASLCSSVLADRQFDELNLPKATDLPVEAQTILHTAIATGLVSVRGDKNAFEPGERYLAICVEKEQGERLEFRIHNDPEQTIRFVEGFRHLCRHGLVMHQLMNEFSLTASGFDIAKTVEQETVSKWVSMGRESV